MSAPSRKTAVTCEKPLRESERVYSRPGMPASAVSIGKVTCFSISTGESDGVERVDLHLAVGDVGHGVDGQARSDADAEHATASSVATTTVQRRWMEKPRIRSSMAAPQCSWPPAPLPSSALTRKELVVGKALAGGEPRVISPVVRPLRPRRTGAARSGRPRRRRPPAAAHAAAARRAARRRPGVAGRERARSQTVPAARRR